MDSERTALKSVGLFLYEGEIKLTEWGGFEMVEWVAIIECGVDLKWLKALE